jgi:hypothetical protein
MTELEIMLLKYPCSMPAKTLRAVGKFFRICSAFEQNKIEYTKLKNISDTYYTNYIPNDVEIKGTFLPHVSSLIFHNLPHTNS